MELRIVAGWSTSSAMPDTYVHLSGGDVERKILKNAGLLDDDDNPGPGPMDPVKCPRCKKMNPPGARFCFACTAALTETIARQVDAAEDAIRASMADDPALMVKVAELLKEWKKNDTQ